MTDEWKSFQEFIASLTDIEVIRMMVDAGQCGDSDTATMCRKALASRKPKLDINLEDGE